MKEPTKPRRRWVMPLLFISLSLNLLVVGAIVGRSFAPDDHRGNRDRVPGALRSVIGEPFVRALEPDDRRALVEDVRREARKIRENRESLRGRFETFLTALRADPFVAEDVKRLLQEQRQVAQGRQELGETLLLNRLTEMDAAARAAYADRLEKSLKALRRR
ncbi:periplasmic heavy metal sensor [Rhodobacteraceae bacterium]|nr:periplasmic heavy metal sensor [Paracoccaceae bacterium]